MAKKVWMTLSVITVAVILGFGMYQSNASQANPTLSSEEIKELVRSQYPGTITELELTQGASGALYEVEIVNDGVEYDLKIDGKTGEIINLKEKQVAAKERANTKETIDLKEKEQEQKAAEKKEKEEKAKAEAEDKQKQEEKKRAEAKKEQAKNEQQQKTLVEKKETEKKQTEKKGNSSKKTVIDVNEAIDIALKQFPGVVDEVELDEDDGRLIYEIEIKNNGEEAEFEIDAYTGEVLVIEIDD